MTRRKGRGRLSAIEQLPKEADEVVRWAAQELKSRERTQLEIWQEFNGRLADLGIGSISKSSFNRHSMKMAELARRVETTREITSVLTERLEPGDEDDLTIMSAQLIKTLVFELLQDGGEAGYSPKQAMEMANAIRAATAAQNISTDRRRKQETDLENKVDEAIDKTAAITGLSSERAAQIRRDVLGVRT